MKKLCLLLCTIVSVYGYSQNNFPSNGQVTIGTTTATPGTALDVNGRVVIDSCLIVKDSVVIENRIRAKDKLIVDDKAIFKNDAVVKLDLRTNGNARFDQNIRVDGTAKLNGDVKMENIGGYNGALDATELLLIKDNGQVKKLDINGLTQYIGALGDALACFEDVSGNIVNADWVSGINKVYVCPGVNVGVGESNPMHAVHIEGTAASRTILVGNDLGPINALINGIATNPNVNLLELGQQTGNGTPQIRFTVNNSGATTIANNSDQTSFRINNGTGSVIELNANNGVNLISLYDNGTLNYRMNGGLGFIIHDQNNNEVMRVANNGILYSKEIIVKVPPFPDYVFDNNYNLMPLSEVKEYVQIKKHLPGIPSAKEIDKKGLGVGDMQVKQMEKIENIYLYLFELEERISSLEKENEYLKDELIKNKQ